jgi:glycine cleavage system H protein
METSSYVDIFASKGIEYLFVIGFLLLLIFFWRYLFSSPRTAATVHEQPGIQKEAWFSLERDVFYHQGHSWVRAEGNDLAVVGIDDFAQRLLGNASSIDLPPVGSRIQQGEKGWRLLFGSKEIDMLSPIEGDVVAINNEILQDPHLLNRDPYGKGWLMSIRVPHMKRNLHNLLSGNLAMSWMKETVDSLRGRMAGNLGIVLQDGGAPVNGIAKALSPDNWHELARDFLLTK